MDFRFLDANLKQLSKFSDEIIVPIFTRLFSGEEEDQELLDKSKKLFDHYNCNVKLFEWDGARDENPMYYHTLNRKLGTEMSNSEWLFFIDTDEIVDDEFVPWVNEAVKTDNTYWLTSYWYFREPIYQATSYEAQGALVKKHKCNWDLSLANDRGQIFQASNFHDGYNGTHILSESGKPMMHHFSWVRTKEQMLKKVKNWGHRHDRDWTSLVEEEFSRPFNGTDFIHNYSYNIVENKFNI